MMSRRHGCQTSWIDAIGMKSQFPILRFFGTACAVCLLSISTPASAWAQEPDTSGQPLGDLARQTRSQHEAAEGTPSKAQELVDEMQQEQEAVENAPAGFKNYDAGDYRLFVPFPYTLEGRDNGGAVLLGSRIGLTNTEVMAGTPIPIPPTIDDVHLVGFLTQLARRYSPGGRCFPVTSTVHKTFMCMLGETQLLGHPVWGNMEFVVTLNRAFPVMCVSPDNLRWCTTYDSNGYYTCQNQPTWADSPSVKAATLTRNSDAQGTVQACEQVIFPSIQLKEDIVVHPASIPENKTSTAPAVAQASAPIGADSQSPSLADLARQTRQAPHGTAQASLDSTEAKGNAPPGYQTFSFQYCNNPQQCEDASIAIPEKAELVSRINGRTSSRPRSTETLSCFMRDRLMSTRPIAASPIPTICGCGTWPTRMAGPAKNPMRSAPSK
jgi:hypothetical protein